MMPRISLLATAATLLLLSSCQTTPPQSSRFHINELVQIVFHEKGVDTSFVTRHTANIAKIQPNGDLYLVSILNFTVGSEIQHLEITGYCHPTDIAPDHTIDADLLIDRHFKTFTTALPPGTPPAGPPTVTITEGRPASQN